LRPENLAFLDISSTNIDAFLNISSTNIDTLISLLYQCVKTHGMEVFASVAILTG
jgi:hypothetical protein